jgi:hypothetical protein
MHLVNFFLLLLVGHCAECLDPSFYSDDKGTIHFEAPSGVCFNQGQGGGIPVAGRRRVKKILPKLIMPASSLYGHLYSCWQCMGAQHSSSARA